MPGATLKLIDNRNAMAYSIIEGRFYYGYPNGDYFDFEGFLSGLWGGGSFVAGERIRPGEPKGWLYDFSSLPNSYVEIKKADNFTGSVYFDPLYKYRDLFF